MIVSLAQLKDYLGIMDSSSDSRLQTALNGVEVMVRVYCARDFTLDTYTENALFQYPRDGYQTRQYPIVSIAGLTVSDVLWKEGVDYWVNRSTGVFTFLDGLVSPHTTLAITYAAGYTASTYPHVLVSAILEQAACNYQGQGSSMLLSERLGDRQYTKVSSQAGSGGLSPLVEGMLSGLRSALFDTL